MGLKTAKEVRRILYFAFGSNLCLAQMQRRCPTACLVGPARLERHELAFRGYSGRWGGSVATVRPSPSGIVNGLLYALRQRDLEQLDKFEGVPHAYVREVRLVRAEDGRRRKAQIYLLVGPLKGIALGPGDEYLVQIRRAYQAYGFDERALASAASTCQTRKRRWG